MKQGPHQMSLVYPILKHYCPVLELLEPEVLDAEPSLPEAPVPDVPVLELPESVLLPVLERLEFLVVFALEFELVVPFLILSSLAFGSVGVVTVLLFSPGVAAALSPLLVAPAIATGTPRQNTKAVAGISFKAAKGSFHIFEVFIFKIS
jgi:hypothetical protein